MAIFVFYCVYVANFTQWVVLRLGEGSCTFITMLCILFWKWHLKEWFIIITAYCTYIYSLYNIKHRINGGRKETQIVYCSVWTFNLVIRFPIPTYRVRQFSSTITSVEVSEKSVWGVAVATGPGSFNYINKSEYSQLNTSNLVSLPLVRFLHV